MLDFIQGLRVLLKRGELTPAKITVPALAGNKGKDILGIIELVLKRTAMVKHLKEEFVMRDPEQQKHVAKFETYLAYDENVPKDVGTSDLGWMTMRTPFCAALTGVMAKTWDGELDEAMKTAQKNAPTAGFGTAFFAASEQLQAEHNKIKCEQELANKQAITSSEAPGVSAGASTSKGASEDSTALPAKSDEEIKLRNKAALRRSEICSLKVCNGSSEHVKTLIEKSGPGCYKGEVGKNHVAIVGDLACAPDGISRPWQRPPCYARDSCAGRFKDHHTFDLLILLLLLS